MNKIKHDISYEEYLTMIKEYLKKMDIKIRNFLWNQIKSIVEYEYPHIVGLIMKSTERECPICFQEYVITDIKNICYFCKKLFHDKCIKEMWKQHHDLCANCRQPLICNLFIFHDVQIKLFQDILKNCF